MTTLWAGTEDSFRLYLSQADWLTTQQAQEAHKACESNKELAASALNSTETGEEETSSGILTVVNSVGIINISGVLVCTDDWYNRYMGYLSQAEIQRALMEAAGNEGVSYILLDVASPGGQVPMTLDTSRMIKEVDKIKPVYGFAETAASGAYWLISAARKRYISATGIAGSIGVVTQHVEYSKRDERDGITRKILRTGEFKQLFNSVEPLTEKAEEETLKLMLETEAVFVREVSSNIGLSIKQLEPALEGREFVGQQAVGVGLFDKVDTFQNVLTMITKKVRGGVQAMKTKKTYELASAFAGEKEPTEEEVAAAALKAATERTAAGEGTEEDAKLLAAELKAATERIAILNAATERTLAGEGTEEDAKLLAELKAATERTDAGEGTEEDAKLLAAATEIKAASDSIAGDKEETEDLVDPNIALLAEKDKEIEVASELVGKLSAIVGKAVGNICVALNTMNPLKEDSGPEEILAVYSEKAELFATECPTGGVASVGEDEEAPKVIALSRLEVARSKQVVVPLNG